MLESDESCLLCRQPDRATSVRYLSLIGPLPGLRSHQYWERKLNLQCSCCDECFRKARGIGWVAFFAIPGFCSALVSLIIALAVAAGMYWPDLDWKLPEQETWAVLAFIVTTFGIIIFIVTFFIDRLIKRRTEKLLPPELSKALLAFLEIPSWSNAHYIWASDTVPASEAHITRSELPG